VQSKRRLREIASQASVRGAMHETQKTNVRVDHLLSVESRFALIRNGRMHCMQSGTLQSIYALAGHLRQYGRLSGYN